jgi:hypothetical protein
MADRFTIQQIDEKRESFGGYRYGIYDSTKLIGYFWHDHRGDDNEVELFCTHDKRWGFPSILDFIQGGGPMPTTLTEMALLWLASRVDGSDPE